ncbi:hypothetical protein Neosp_010885 [[Neocosmospora] mangrovei]
MSSYRVIDDSDIAPGVRSLYLSERRSTKYELLNQAQDAIDALEVQLEEDKRLASIASRIKGQGTDWKYELEHRKHLRRILAIDRELMGKNLCSYGGWLLGCQGALWLDEDIRGCSRMLSKSIKAKRKFINASSPSELTAANLANQQSNQLQGPQNADVPSLVALLDRTSKDRLTHREALCAIQGLDTLFRRVKASIILLLPHFGNKGMEEGPKEILQEMIFDLFGYGHDMSRLYRSVPIYLCGVGRFIAGQFDRAISRLANRLKNQLSTLERIAGQQRSCGIRVRYGPRPTLESSIQRGNREKETFRKFVYNMHKTLRIIETAEYRFPISDLFLDPRFSTRPFLFRLEKEVETQYNKLALIETLGIDFLEAVFEGACDLYEAESMALCEIALPRLEKVCSLTSSDIHLRRLRDPWTDI